MKLNNNLFSYATSELSQDAFLCWLVSFAMEDAEPDAALHMCARKLLEAFVPELEGVPFVLTDIRRQVAVENPAARPGGGKDSKIDVLLTVRTERQSYQIVVEDKTHTGEHDNQLTRYINGLEQRNCASGKQDCIVRGVYYKSGFMPEKEFVEKTGYRVITRTQMLALLEPYVRQTENQILRDYYACWSAFEQSALRYQNLPVARWESGQLLAFYENLRDSGFHTKRNAWMGYGTVSNAAGGFEGLWIGVDEELLVGGVNCQLYPQIEAVPACGERECALSICLKLALHPQKGQSISPTAVRNALIYDERGAYCLERFHYQKPRILRPGMHMTIGVYRAPAETASQLRETLAAAFGDYRELLEFLKNRLNF